MAPSATAAAAEICETCGTLFEPTGRTPAHCPICDDERQYLGWGGQRWTRMDALVQNRHVEFVDENGVTQFQDLFGYTRGRQIIGNAKAAVDASFERYLAAIAEPSHPAAAVS